MFMGRNSKKKRVRDAGSEDDAFYGDEPLPNMSKTPDAPRNEAQGRIDKRPALSFRPTCTIVSRLLSLDTLGTRALQAQALCKCCRSALLLLASLMPCSNNGAQTWDFRLRRWQSISTSVTR